MRELPRRMRRNERLVYVGLMLIRDGLSGKGLAVYTEVFSSKKKVYQGAPFCGLVLEMARLCLTKQMVWSLSCFPWVYS